MPQLVAGLAPIMGWERSGDRFADRDAHHSSVRRWLRWLQAAGLVAARSGLNDAGEEARTEITLLEPGDIDEQELRAARARLTVWGAASERSAPCGGRLAGFPCYFGSTRVLVQPGRPS